MPPVACPEPVKVVFARSKFTIDVGKDRRAIYAKNLVIYDIAKIETIIDPRMTLAVFLEELVHVYLGVSDEVQASLKVCELYPEIKADPKTGKYLLL